MSRELKQALLVNSIAASSSSFVSALSAIKTDELSLLANYKIDQHYPSMEATLGQGLQKNKTPRPGL